jgi:alkanesulfonate monooxygenase SsuD/methylene tetrahydromethanopterin reductase-like flavin-dependent oxidoreductase (luciferase family)
MAATLQEVSNGRVALGLGAGYDEAEHRAFGFPWERRVNRLEDAAAILDDLLHRGISARVGDSAETLADEVANLQLSADGAGARPPGIDIGLASKCRVVASRMTVSARTITVRPWAKASRPAWVPEPATRA